MRASAPACVPDRARRARRGRARGFTLMEILMAMAIMGVLTMASLAGYDHFMSKARGATAVTDMIDIATRIKEFELNNRRLPDDLGEIGRAGKLDPWGRPYEYFNLQTSKGNGKARKRKNLAPLNSDYDLYSVGKDGDSSSSLMPKVSHDDIVRALDGRFMGMASDFDP